MHMLAESKNYLVYKNYEDVILRVKATGREIQIGDFYGEADMAVISEDEKYCAMCGCGVIIYFLVEPFQEYEYDLTTDQWKDWGRNCAMADICWADKIRCIDNNVLEVVDENGNITKLNVYEL